jgi:hypothetical protein
MPRKRSRPASGSVHATGKYSSRNGARTTRPSSVQLRIDMPPRPSARSRIHRAAARETRGSQAKVDCHGAAREQRPGDGAKLARIDVDAVEVLLQRLEVAVGEVQMVLQRHRRRPASAAEALAVGVALDDADGEGREQREAEPHAQERERLQREAVDAQAPVQEQQQARVTTSTPGHVPSHQVIPAEEEAPRSWRRAAGRSVASPTVQPTRSRRSRRERSAGSAAPARRAVAPASRRAARRESGLASLPAVSTSDASALRASNADGRADEQEPVRAEHAERRAGRRAPPR